MQSPYGIKGLIVRRHSRQSEIPALPESVSCPTTSLPHYCPTRLSSNSFSHNLLSDPHPLNPVVPIFYKNGGRRVDRKSFNQTSPPLPERRSRPGRDVHTFRCAACIPNGFTGLLDVQTLACQAL